MKYTPLPIWDAKSSVKPIFAELEMELLTRPDKEVKMQPQ